MNNSPSLDGLRTRLMRAGIWTLTGYFVETSTRLITTLIMTRLLVPEDFGLMALAISIPAGLALLSDFGIRASVIKRHAINDSAYLQTAWTLQSLRGVVLWGVTLLLAMLLLVPQVKATLPEDSTIAHPLLPAVLAAMGANLAISGLNSINIHVQERNISARPIVIRSIASKIIAFAVMLVWAGLDRSVWALVAGALSYQIVFTFLSHYLGEGEQMWFSWNKQLLTELLSDGKWITLSTASWFFVSQGDRLILAALLSAQQMGLYAIALTFVEIAKSLLQSLFGQFALPVLSELYRTRPAKAKDVYYKFRRPVDVLTFMAVGFVWFAGPEIIVILYDERYAGSGWILQVLGLTLATSPFLMSNVLFMANNELRSYSVNAVFQSISFLLAMIIGYYLAGWEGVIWGIALYGWPATILILAKAYRKNWIDPVREIRMLPFVLVGAALGAAAQWILQWLGALV